MGWGSLRYWRAKWGFAQDLRTRPQERLLLNKQHERAAENQDWAAFLPGSQRGMEPFEGEVVVGLDTQDHSPCLRFSVTCLQTQTNAMVTPVQTSVLCLTCCLGRK